jgi:hypothetical protein
MAPTIIAVAPINPITDARSIMRHPLALLAESFQFPGHLTENPAKIYQAIWPSSCMRATRRRTLTLRRASTIDYPGQRLLTLSITAAKMNLRREAK